MANTGEAKVHDIPSPAVAAFLARKKGLLIDGEWRAALDGGTLAVYDPATGRELTTVAAAGPKDVDAAVAAATRAFAAPEWVRLRPSDRERMLLRLADLIEANSDELAELESRDNGKSMVLAKKVDVRSAADYLRYIAGWATKLEGSTLDASFPRPRNGGDYFAYTRREPVGVVGAIIPWNFPLLMAAWKIGPALATGCTVVLKPAEETPLTALRLGELIIEAGIPRGVVNILPGEGAVAGAALVSHSGVAKVAFTGSTEIGKLIGRQAMDRMARVSLELGGKSPVIIFDDADVAAAIGGAASAIFYNQGQVCCAGSRLYVQRSLFDKVVGGIVDSAQAMRLGPGTDAGAQMGPLVSERQRDRVCAFIDGAARDGGSILTGGRVDGDGYFVRPTVIADAAHSAAIVQEEVFGPVLVVTPFDDVEDVVRLANDSIYGLAASIWTRDLSRAHRLIPRIQAGTVWVNCHNMIDPVLPFGGFKQSGMGREMGRAVLDLYTETKSVCILA